MKKAVVIGATGDVGRGIVATLCNADFKVTAVGRNRSSLEEFQAELSPSAVDLICGSLATTQEALQLSLAVAKSGRPDLVVVSVNGELLAKSVSELEPTAWERIAHENVSPHLSSARAFLPIINDGGAFVGIGGGMADQVFPNMAAVSMAQAAQRIFYQHLAAEPGHSRVHIRELRLYSMINGKSSRARAQASWITAEEVGQHLLAVIGDLETFAGPVLALKSKKQLGLPER